MTDAGHVRISNRLFEAVLSAPFSATQRQVILTILRLSLGWQRRTVIVSYAELARYAGSDAVSGGFRRAIKELVREAVLFIGSTGGGAEANAYMVNDQYERWGRFSQATAKLEAVWGQRPEHSDEQLPLRILELLKSSHPDPAGSPPLTLQGQAPCPSRVTPPDPAGSGSRASSADARDGSGLGKTLKDRKTNNSDSRGESLELLAKIDELREQQGAGPVHIRLDRVRSELGADVADACKIARVISRLLAGKPELHGVIAANFADALARVRRRGPPQAGVG